MHIRLFLAIYYFVSVFVPGVYQPVWESGKLRNLILQHNYHTIIAWVKRKISRGSYACKEKYAKKITTKDNDTSLVLPNGGRVINLIKLQEHPQVIGQHSAICLQYNVNTVSVEEAIVLASEQNCEDICSILISCCSGVKGNSSSPTFRA